MTEEEFKKNYQSDCFNFVLGVDSDLQKTLVDKRNGEHWALTLKNYDDILELFTKLGEES